MYSEELLRLRALHDELLKAQTKEENPQVKHCIEDTMFQIERLELTLQLLSNILDKE